MAEKVYILDEYFAAARALGVKIGANPDESPSQFAARVEKAYEARLKECAGDAQRKEQLLHAKAVLTGPGPTMEELTLYHNAMQRKQFRGPAHSERPPTIPERVQKNRGNGKSLWSYAKLDSGGENPTDNPKRGRSL